MLGDTDASLPLSCRRVSPVPANWVTPSRHDRRPISAACRAFDFPRSPNPSVAYWPPCTRLVMPTVGNDQMVIVDTRRAGPDDLRPGSQVLGEAFADYPWTRWTVDPDDHEARITQLQFLALENLGMPFGEVWLSSVDSAIQSVAVWMDSAVPIPSSVHHGMDAAVAQLEGSRHDASLAATREIKDWRPTERHFTLVVVGTMPTRQREGLGGRTLAPGLAAADREGAGSFLETSSASNLAFYSTFGFEVVGHRRLRGGS